MMAALAAVGPDLRAVELLLLFLLWLALPLVPALLELKRPTDVRPLRVVREYDGNIRYFARGFQAFLERSLPGCLATSATLDAPVTGELEDGTTYTLHPGGGWLEPTSHETETATVGRIIVCGGALQLPARLRFSHELLVRGELAGGSGNIYRAILGESTIRLGAGSAVLRWLHGNGSVTIENGTTLYGRASSDRELWLGCDCTFERLHASRVVFGGSVADHLERSARPEDALYVVESLPGEYDPLTGRTRVGGNLTIPPHSVFEGDIVVSGRLRVGAGTRLVGNLKSSGHMMLEGGVDIEGSVVSGRTLQVGRSSRIKGPLIAEGTISIGSGSRIGSLIMPTTVSAPEIEVSDNVVVWGTVWARRRGRVRTSC